MSSDVPNDTFSAFGPATFGELNASDYDETQDPGTTQATVDLIAELVAPGASLLELAIGTGRIALPLAARGFHVSGIEGSPQMVDLLLKKPGGQDIPVAIGDFADVEIAGTYDHAFLVFNTLFNLPSQEAQLRCFKNVAKRLRDGGTFLIETFVPDLSKFEDHQHVRTRRLDMNSVWLEAVQHDPVQQRFEYQRIRITENGMKLVPLVMRYALPAEIDLMAQLAGMQLKSRWGGWDKTDFTADSKMHISVYEKSSSD